jgi:hypothetical protein
MKIAICTISTHSHLYKSKALHVSLLPLFDGDFCCLVTDAAAVNWENDAKIHDLESLESKDVISFKEKYKSDKLRWALKPVYIKYLLDSGYEKVIYVDNDIYFFNSPFKLFDKLKTSSILLTPHFYPSDPKSHQNWLEANFRVGLYNAGFIGVSKSGVEILDWWTNCCLYNVKKSFWRGLFDDQKYLDLVPIIFEGVGVVKDTGCNLAGWNFKNRLNSSKGPNLESITFVHFAELTIKEFSKIDSPFHPLWKLYEEQLIKFNDKFTLTNSTFSFRNLNAYLYFLCWRIVRLFEKK